MLPVDPLTLSTLLILAGTKPNLCPVPPPTKINMLPSTAEISFDTTQTLAQLQGYSMDTVNPYGFHTATITQAFMKGQIVRKYEVKLDHKFLEKYNAYCLWYEDITVRIEIAPTIVIAKELYKDLCMRKALIGHESKHVMVDRQVVNDYAKSIGQKLYSDLKSRGFSAGPIPAEYGQETVNRMQKVVIQILELEFQKMDIDRMERQRAVDNLEEYESVDKKCESFRIHNAKLYESLKAGRQKRPN